MKWENFVKVQQMLPHDMHDQYSLVSFGQVVSDEKIFEISANQKQELLVAAMFANQSRHNEDTL